MNDIEFLFSFPLYRLEVPNWNLRKQRVLDALPEMTDEHLHGGTYTDYRTSGAMQKLPSYEPVVTECLAECLAEFRDTYPDEVRISSMWFEKSVRSTYRGVRNYSSLGFTGMLMVEHDRKEHAPTRFISPHMNYHSGELLDYRAPNVEEGVLFMFPSVLLHDIDPNDSDKPLTVICFTIPGTDSKS